MMRSLTTKHAARLRPIAIERARQGKMQEGDEVFYGGICYGRVSIYRIYDTKPYKAAILEGRNSMFRGNLAYAYPTMAEYEASHVHWDGPPRIR